MRTRGPITSVDEAVLTVRTELTLDDGTALPALEVTLPREAADLLDPTATPTLPLLAALAAARGEDVEVTGTADATAVDATRTLAGRLAARWTDRGGAPTGTDRLGASSPSHGVGPRTPALRVDATHRSPAGPGRGVGLLFDGGVDAWAALLLAGEADRDDAVTHLVVARSAPTTAPALPAETRAVAADRGLILVELATTAPAVLSAAGAPPEAEVLGRASAALTAGAGLRRLVVPDPAGAALLPGFETDGPRPTPASGAVEVVGAPHRTWVERVALVAADPRARAAVRACPDASASEGCGRCVPCLLLRSAFVLVGDPEPGAGFASPLSLHAVRFASLDGTHAEAVTALVDGLPPDHEVLRRAWSDAWDESQGRPTPSRWGLDGPPALPGPDGASRVAAALRATTGRPDGPMPSRLGWQAATVPLRPALADHDAVRAAAAGPGRPRAWAVIEPHVRDGRRDGEQSRLALRAQQALGPGLAYLPGILWSDDQSPVLGPRAISRLLHTARARLWWRDDGDLDPLRTVEAVEHGCLPLQVMPDGAAAALAATLPSALAPLVVADSAVPYLDLSPDAVTVRLDPALDHILGGSSERDLLRGTSGG